jgi:NitT/TauT family transport system ATP-binding protein
MTALDSQVVARAQGINHAFVARSRAGEAPLAVLSDVSLEVRESELVTVIGPSGCGKTTLLRILAGLVRRSDPRGSAEIGGRPVSGPSPHIGYVFQQGALLPWRTVQKNVEFSLEVRHHRNPRPEEHQRATQMIRLVGLAGFETYYPYQLSGGMQQRVGFARALVTEPRLILLDEPFAALDAQSRRLLQDELIRWKRAQHFAGILVTHDLDEAIYLSDRILVMSARPGRIIDEIPIDLDEIRGAPGFDLHSWPGYPQIRARLWDCLLPQNLQAAPTAVLSANA